MIAGMIHLLFAVAGAVAGALVCGCTLGFLFMQPPSLDHVSVEFLVILMLVGWPGTVIGGIVGGFCGLWYGNRFTGD